jgi:hypothetical protein
VLVSESAKVAIEAVSKSELVFHLFEPSEDEDEAPNDKDGNAGAAAEGAGGSSPGTGTGAGTGGDKGSNDDDEPAITAYRVERRVPIAPPAAEPDSP